MSLSWSSRGGGLNYWNSLYNIVSDNTTTVKLFVKELNGEGNLTYINEVKDNVTYVFIVDKYYIKNSKRAIFFRLFKKLQLIIFLGWILDKHTL